MRCTSIKFATASKPIIAKYSFLTKWQAWFNWRPTTDKLFGNKVGKHEAIKYHADQHDLKLFQ